MARHRTPGRNRKPGRHRRPGRIRTRLRPGVVGAAAATIAVVGLPAWPAAAAVPAVNWGPIIACESGGDPGATNPVSTASGLYQFLDSTWASLGGTAYSPRAKGATAAQQLVIANRAYAQSGFTPWAASRACWANRFDATAPSPASKSLRGGREGSSPARVAGRLVSPALIDAAPDSRAQLATAYALARVGSPCPPSWSGATAGRGGPGVDGSGLTAAAYAAAGITLPATAAIQYDRGPRVRAGTELLAGDLVFYGTPSAVRHTGIYIGDGNMIHAAAPDQLVQRTTYRWPGDDYLGAVRPTTARSAPPSTRSAPQSTLSAVAFQTVSPPIATAQSPRLPVGVFTPPPPPPPTPPPVVPVVLARPAARPAPTPPAPPVGPERSPAEGAGTPTEHPVADSEALDHHTATTQATALRLTATPDITPEALSSPPHPAPASAVPSVAGWVSSREPRASAVVSAAPPLTPVARTTSPPARSPFTPTAAPPGGSDPTPLQHCFPGTDERCQLLTVPSRGPSPSPGATVPGRPAAG